LVHRSVYDDLCSGDCSIALIGLGYVGLPLALEFAKDFQVVGYDLKEEHVHQLSNGIDPSGEMPSGSFEERKIRFTTDESHISTARVYIVAVPTPVDESNAPDLSMLRSASRTVAENLRPGDYDVMIHAVGHQAFLESDPLSLEENLSDHSLIMDISGQWRVHQEWFQGIYEAL